MQTDISPRPRRARNAAAIVLLSAATSSIRLMQLSKKIKTALDETRMLILGAQILLGFELRSAFSEGFDKLYGHISQLEALALMLMVISVALMIAPGPYHQIVEGGRDSSAFHKVAMTVSE